MRSGSAYADIQQNAINFVCLFANCTDEYVLYHQIPLLIQNLENAIQILMKNVNPKCFNDFAIVLQEIENVNFNALKFIDSWGKIPSGMLEGNLRAWGRSDECLATTVVAGSNAISTDYCLSSIPTPLGVEL